MLMVFAIFRKGDGSQDEVYVSSWVVDLLSFADFVDGMW
jgi:hypothetical protein